MAHEKNSQKVCKHVSLTKMSSTMLMRLCLCLLASMDVLLTCFIKDPTKYQQRSEQVLFWTQWAQGLNWILTRLELPACEQDW